MLLILHHHTFSYSTVLSGVVILENATTYYYHLNWSTFQTLAHLHRTIMPGLEIYKISKVWEAQAPCIYNWHTPVMFADCTVYTCIIFIKRFIDRVIIYLSLRVSLRWIAMPMPMAHDANSVVMARSENMTCIPILIYLQKLQSFCLLWRLYRHLIMDFLR